MTDIFKAYADKRKAEYMQHVSKDVKDRAECGQPISLAEWELMRLNSYEQELLYPLLADDALLQVVQNCLDNCWRHSSRRPCSTYDDAMMVIFVPLLLERMERLMCKSCGSCRTTVVNGECVDCRH